MADATATHNAWQGAMNSINDGVVIVPVGTCYVNAPIVWPTYDREGTITTRNLKVIGANSSTVCWGINGNSVIRAGHAGILFDMRAGMRLKHTSMVHLKT